MNTLVDIAKHISNSAVDRAKDRKVKYGIIHAIDTTTIDVRPGNSTSVIRHVSVIGDVNTLAIGDIVTLSWWDNKRPFAVVDMNRDNGFTYDPYAWYEYSYGNFTAVNEELERLSAAIQSVDLGHIENPGGYIGGWILDADNMYSGSGSDRVQLSTAANGYRIWAGAELWTDAPFSVQKNGTIKATLGQIAGWTLAENQFSADNGNAILNSSEYPYLGLGGATGYGENGIWIGKDTDGTYKIFIGNPAGGYLSWDGSDLNVNGTIEAINGAIGGWIIGTDKISADGGDVTLQAGTNPYIGLDGANGFNQTGIWFGKDTDDIYKMSIGDPSSNHVAWNGSQLVVQGTVVFAEQEASLVGGWLIVAKDNGFLIFDVGSLDTEIDFGQAMTPGDYVLIRAHDINGVAQSEYILVGAVVSGTTYSVTRTSPQAWFKGTIYQVLGQTGDGYIELSASGQRMSVMEQTATPNTPNEVIRIGELTGWQSAGLSGNGLAIGDYANDIYLSYDPTNGLIVKGTINADDGYLGDLDISGELTVTSSGKLIAGNGNVVIDNTGIILSNWSNNIRFGPLDRSTSYGYGFLGGLSLGLTDTDYSLYMSAYQATGSGGAGTRVQVSSTDDVYGVFSVTRSSGSVFPLMYVDVAGTLHLPTSSTAIVLGGTGDTNLYRSAANVLKTDDALYVTGNLTAASTLLIGADTNLYRAGENLLKTDDALLVVGNITTADYLSTNACVYIKEVASGSTPGPGYSALFISNDGGLPFVRNDEALSIPLFERSVQFDVTSGRLSGATKSADGSAPCIILRNGYTDYVNWNFILPPGWAGKDVNAIVYLTPSSTNTGAIRMYADMKYLRHGENVPASPQTSYTLDVTMPGVISRVVKIVMPMTLASFQEGDAVSWGVTRFGTATQDTFTGNTNILAVELQLDVTM